MSQSNVSELSRRIRDEAGRLGFAGVGIARADSLPCDEKFTAWLAQGFNGEMHYLQRQAEKRRNPGLVLANAKSVLVAALNYYTDFSPATAPLKGRVSRYAWGGEYHDAVKRRLDSLLAFIHSIEPSAHGRCYVDTGPVMEKVWGAQTALGWMGKHTNLISRNLGSWFFIGIILLDIDLGHDSSEKDYCGRCRRCIEACPTGAIVAPYVLDARLCVSYLTIELRGPIPHRLRPLIGNRIFGCDDCQEVCPWNRFATATSHKAFNPRAEIAAPDLISLARITSWEFEQRFSNSPVKRATRDGLVRNVMVALGNSGIQEAVPVLEDALKDGSPLVRSHAAWALGRIGTRRAIEILEATRIRESDASVLEEIGGAVENGRTAPK